MDAKTKRIVTNLETQGFTGYSPEFLKKVNIGLRTAPFFCMFLGAGVTLAESPKLTLILALIALSGAILPGHPFDLVYHWFVRPHIGGEKIPNYPFRRRMTCFMAGTMLIAEAWAFQSGHFLTAHLLGWQLVGVAGLVALTGFCIPSWMLDKVIPVKNRIDFGYGI